MAFLFEKIIAIIILINPIMFCIGCNKSHSTCNSVVHETGDSRNWKLCGSGGGYAYYTTKEQAVESMLVYGWKNETLTKFHDIKIKNEIVVGITWFPDKYYLIEPLLGDGYHGEYRLREISTGNLVKKYDIPDGWFYANMGISRNGEYVTVGLLESPVHPPTDIVPKHPRCRLGIISTKTKEFIWAGDLIAVNDGLAAVRQLMPSDNGVYIAAAGWENGIAIFDATNNKQLWSKLPRRANLGKVAIHPDNKRVYTGGYSGGVFCMDIMTGKIMSRWWTSNSGNNNDVQRVTSIAVSPDGKFVAAGTGPMGKVYVWSTITSKRIKVLGETGGNIPIVIFSPNSKQIAAFQPGIIEIMHLD